MGGALLSSLCGQFGGSRGRVEPVQGCSGWPVDLEGQDMPSGPEGGGELARNTTLP